MEELNDITFWKFVKLHWRLVVLAILFPLIIQLISIIPNNLTHIFDEPSKWTEVWAGYGGALLSVGIALVILYKQYKQNHEENEANRKQNELQNRLNLNLQINALKFQQKSNWYFELKDALSNLATADDLNMLYLIKIDIISYYYNNNRNEIVKAKTEINKTLNDCFIKIQSCYTSFTYLLNKGECKELVEDLRKLNNNVLLSYNLLNNMRLMISCINHPLNGKLTKEEIAERINKILEDDKEELKDLSKNEIIARKTILKKYLEIHNYDFYGNIQTILNSIYDDFKKKVDMNDIIDDILQFERDKIDKLLDVEEIKKNLNAN